MTCPRSLGKPVAQRVWAGWSSDVLQYSRTLPWKLADEKNYMISHFLLKQKVKSFLKLLPTFHPVFLPVVHLLIKIQRFKSSLDLLKDSMKKFNLLWEHWFFLKTNISLQLNFSHSAKGRKSWEMPSFSFPQCLEGTTKRTATNPRLHQSFAVHHPPPWLEPAPTSDLW